MDPISNKTALAAAGAGGERLYVDDVFSTFLYEGTGSAQTITNGIDLSGEEGLVWLKARESLSSPYTGLEFHCLFDNVRSGATGGSAGGGGRLRTDSNQAEQSSTYLDSYNSDGFTLTSTSSVSAAAVVNETGKDFVSWTFRKAPGFFDVVTYTGDGTANRAIAHGLGSVPGAIIVKCTSDTTSWPVYHRSIGTQNALQLDTTSAVIPSSLYFPTTPTSSQFFVSDDTANFNASGRTYVAYLFAHDDQSFGTNSDEAIINCGTYTEPSSGSTTQINLGFEPQWILWKKSNGSGNWYMFDTMRGLSVSGGGFGLFADGTNAEADYFGTTPYLAPTSTGFSATGGYFGAGSNMIYIAIRRPHKPPTDATDVFSALARTGTGSTTVTAAGLTPDTAIINYLPSGGHFFFDRLRGQNRLDSTSTGVEVSSSLHPKFDQMSGVELQGAQYNSNGAPMIDWYLRRAPGFFDVVTYTGNGVYGATSISHNLGVAPEMIWVKGRDVGESWTVGAFDWTKYLTINTTNAQGTWDGAWFDTAPTDSNFAVGFGNNVNQVGKTYVAYLFATLAGISKVGTYSGTGSNVNVDCGFSAGARFVLIKRTDSTGDWYVWDTARGIVSGNDPYLLTNSTAAEVTTTDYIDPLNAGFTVTSSAPAALNASGGAYLFLAIA